jgi:hypothetical protein
MQLSISLPVPSAPQASPSPAANFLSDLTGGSAGSSGNAGQSFSQILAGKPSSDGSGSATGSPSQASPGAAPTTSSGTKPTTAQEEAAAAVGAATLASHAQHPAPTVPEELPSVAPKPVAAASTLISAQAANALPRGGVAHAPAAKPSLSPLAASASPPPTTATQAPAAHAAAVTAPAPAATGSLASQVAQAASGEKFAVPPSNDSAPNSTAAKAAIKKIQSASGKQVTDTSQPVGTAVAKVTATMPPTATLERPASATPLFAVTPQAPSSGSPAQQQPAQAEATGTAKGAVEAAMTAAEMLNSGAAPGAMNFQFTMGDADLNLRVELRNGSVQATFSTDSPQLRSDLANEWQSSASGNSQSSLHLAQPVFTGAGGSASGQQQGRNGGSPSEAQSSASRSFSGGSSAPALEDEPQLVPAASASSLHLQTFA